MYSNSKRRKRKILIFPWRHKIIVIEDVFLFSLGQRFNREEIFLFSVILIYIYIYIIQKKPQNWNKLTIDVLVVLLSVYNMDVFINYWVGNSITLYLGVTQLQALAKIFD